MQLLNYFFIFFSINNIHLLYIPILFPIQTYRASSVRTPSYYFFVSFFFYKAKRGKRNIFILLNEKPKQNKTKKKTISFIHSRDNRITLFFVVGIVFVASFSKDEIITIVINFKKITKRKNKMRKKSFHFFFRKCTNLIPHFLKVKLIKCMMRWKHILCASDWKETKITTCFNWCVSVRQSKYFYTVCGIVFFLLIIILFFIINRYALIIQMHRNVTW